VEILGAAIGPLARGTARAMDFAGTEMFGPVQRDQDLAIQASERFEHAFRPDGFVKQRVERVRGGSVEHLTDMRIGWNFGHSEQRLAIRPSVAFFKPSLIIQERRASHEEQRERRQSDVGHCVRPVTAGVLAPIGKPGTDTAQFADQGLEDGHTAIESNFGARRQANRCNHGGKATKIRVCGILDSVRSSHPPSGDSKPDESHLELLLRDLRGPRSSFV
jgi:hypothetical protein